MPGKYPTTELHPSTPNPVTVKYRWEIFVFQPVLGTNKFLAKTPSF